MQHGTDMSIMRSLAREKCRCLFSQRLTLRDLHSIWEKLPMRVFSQPFEHNRPMPTDLAVVNTSAVVMSQPVHDNCMLQLSDAERTYHVRSSLDVI